MIFHYINGTLMSEISMRPLTRVISEYNEVSWVFYTYQDDKDDIGYWDLEPPHSWYGGYRYFVCESLSREAAQMIVNALGGYLVPELDVVPISHRLGSGGPFFVHRFSLSNPYVIDAQIHYSDAQKTAENAIAMGAIDVYAGGSVNERTSIRIYDNAGFLVEELK